MSLTQLKGQKKIILIAVAVVLIIIAALVFLKKPAQTVQEAEVVSKRAKYEPPKPPEPAQAPDAVAQQATAIQTAPEATKPEKTQPAIDITDRVVEKPQKTQIAEKVEKVLKPEPEKKPQTEPAKPEKIAEKSKKEPAKQKTAQKKETAPVPASVWALNVASFSNAKEAQSLVDTLKRGGYNTYITGFVMDGTKWYRVRVGFYPTKEEAAKISKALIKKYRLQDSWIVMPAPDERQKHTK